MDQYPYFDSVTNVPKLYLLWETEITAEGTQWSATVKRSDRPFVWIKILALQDERTHYWRVVTRDSSQRTTQHVVQEALPRSQVLKALTVRAAAWLHDHQSPTF